MDRDEQEGAMARGSSVEALRGREAVALGKRLIRRYPDFTGGYELAARGYDDLGRHKRAVRILKRGLSRRADSWRLLESLAIRYSQLGRCQEALALLDRAIAIASDQASLHYNRALVLARMDDADEALRSALRALERDPCLSQASLLAAAIECAMGDLAAARSRLTETIERLLAAGPQGRDRAALSDAYRALAEIELAYGRRESALELFWQAIAHEKHNVVARYWIRELSGQRNASSCYWRLVVTGTWPGDEPAPNDCPLPPDLERAAQVRFETLYDVVAETAEEALELARRFEPPRVRPSLRIASAKVMKRSVADPKGVYRTSPYRWKPDMV